MDYDLQSPWVPCWFCRGSYAAAEHGGIPAVVHTEPTCSEYDELDIVDFMERNRRARSN